MTTSVGVFVPTDARYANQYLVRQARSLGATIVTRADEELAAFAGPCEVRHIGGKHPITRVLSRGSLSCWRRLGLGPIDPLNGARLQRGLREVDVAYTMFLPNAAEMVARRAPGRPAMVCHAAGSDVTALPGLPATARKWSISAVERSDLVLCGSEFLHQCLVRQARPQRSTVHYIGVPIPSAATDVSDRRSTRIRFIAVARLHPVKGPRQTIEAFAAAFPKRDEIELHIVGDGPERRAAEHDVDRLGLTEQVVFHGEVPPDRVEQLIRDAHVFVQHNQRAADGSEEALGGSILEASSHGLPVVATRSGGVPEAVVEGDTGYLVDPGDVRGMAEAMRALAEDASLRVRLGRAGRAFVTEHHNAEIQDARLATLLEEL